MKLSRNVTILDAGGLIAAMRQNLTAGEPLRIDASGVEHIDACILQLLCAARHASHDVSIERPSDEFIEATHRSGLEHRMLYSLQEVA
jgi:anti-anti-sigma regulatory factor